MMAPFLVLPSNDDHHINRFLLRYRVHRRGHAGPEGEIGYGVIVAFIIYVKGFSEPLNRLSNSLSMMQNVGASSERVFEFLDLPEVEDESHKPGHPWRIQGRVVFEDVCFSSGREGDHTRHEPDGGAGPEGRRSGPDRIRKDHDSQYPHEVLRAGFGQDNPGRD
jgi:ABC-type multidrug transport system fused ATPase/permease subunit